MSKSLGLRPSVTRAGTGSQLEEPLSISELVGLIGETLAAGFSRVLVAGELSSFKRHSMSGHCYFTLSDGKAAIDGVLWRGDAARLSFDPRAGDEVVCRGRVGVYDKQGRMQLYASSMCPVGAGQAQKALEALKRRLAAEGLFDAERKRPLPFLPRTIGVVTSRSGAALQDILTTLHRRLGACRVVVSPAAVQGEEAPRELVAALEALAHFTRCEVVIIGRGGGATEDLAAFNDEALVRTVAGFPVPVVSAVGHEIDYSLCDLAADRRAPTPTAAAELVVPVRAEIVDEIAALQMRLLSGARRYVEHLRHRVGSTAGRLRDPATLVARARQRADDLWIRLERELLQSHRRAELEFSALSRRAEDTGVAYLGGLERRVNGLASRLQRAAAGRLRTAEMGLAGLCSKLEALSPLGVLERGYCLASDEHGRLIRSAAEIKEGDLLGLRFHRGGARTRVLETANEEEE